MNKCAQCPKKMNPVEVMLGPVCGNCVRKNHRLCCQPSQEEKVARIQRTVILKVLIECEEDFDIRNLGVCIVEEKSHSLVETDKGFFVDDLLFLPRADYCEIVDYIEIREE